MSRARPSHLPTGARGAAHPRILETSMTGLRRLSRLLLLPLLATPLLATPQPALCAAPAPNEIVGLDDGFDPGANGIVQVLAQQADGQLLVAGSFDYIGGGQALNLARLRVDGRLDPSFDVDVNGSINAVLPLDDGRVLISGYFSEVDQVPRYTFAALRQDGRLDADFELQLNVGDAVLGMARQPDGGILLAGQFQDVGGRPTGLVRLRADGRVDADFVPFFAEEGWYTLVYSATTQPDGRIVAAGQFESPDGSTRLAFVRLNPDGSEDTSFRQPPTEIAQQLALMVRKLVALGDGSVVGAGTFELPDGNGGTQTHLLKLHRDGGLDANFRPDPNAPVRDVAVQPDGRILVAGAFSRIDGLQTQRIARLQPDGSLDASFVAGASAPINTVAMLADGKIALGGEFTRIGGESRQRLARLEIDGRVETAFLAGSDPIYPGLDAAPRCLVQLPDQQWLIGCGFGYVGTVRMDMARLRADGSIDPGFVAPVFEPGFTNSVDVISPQPDGKFLIGGRFTKVNGVARPGVARLNADGSLDASFAPPNWAGPGTPWARALALQPDGRVLVSGWYEVTDPFQYVPTMNRLDADGSLDASFHVPALDNPVEPLQVLPDGKILLAGHFAHIDGTPRAGVARLNADGTLDPAFASPLEEGGSVSILQPLPDGRILLAGNLLLDGDARRLARLNADGTLDRSFVAADPDNLILSLAVQANGAIALGGAFTRVGGEVRRNFARLLPDGSLDPDNQPAVGGWVTAMAQQADGKLLIAGDFSQVDGLSRAHLARLPAIHGASRRLAVDAAGTLRWTLGGSSPPATEVRFDLSLDGRTWTPLGQGQPSASGWRYAAGATLPRDTAFWVRAQGRTGSREGATGNGSVSLLESTLFARLDAAAVYTITPQAGPGGRLDPAKAVATYAGTRRAFDVIADAGYAIDDVSGCGGSLAGTVYTTAPVSADCTVVATFRADDPDRIFASGFESATR